MSNRSESSSGGIGLCGATFIVFLILKLCHVIDWSWWWVTAPLWLGGSVFFAAAVLMLIIAIVRNPAGAERAGLLKPRR